MYTKIDEYKDTLKSDEQQYDVYIVLEDGTTVDTDISGFKIISNLGQKIIGNFVARRIEFNLFNTNLYNITNKEFEAFVGLKVNGEFNYISLGKFIANKPEVKDEKTDECSITAQDYSLKFKVQYEPVITFPCTVSSAIQQICKRLGIAYKTNSFINADYILEEFFIDEEATFYDVIKTLVEAGFANAHIDNSNSLIIRSPKKTSDYSFALNEIFELQKQDNKFGPLNAVVASRVVADDGSTTEDVYARNEQSITQNGIYEYKIIQNDAIDYDRQTAVDNMLAGILDFQYVPATIEAVYNPATEVGDLLEVPDVKTDTSFLLYVKEITADLASGLMTIESSEETATETDYKSATAKDKRKRTEYKVNKMEGKINALVSSVEEIEQELVLTATTEESKVFHLPDSADNNCKSVKIFGESTQETRSGINKIRFTNLDKPGKNGVSITSKDGILTCSGTPTAFDYIAIVNRDIQPILPAGTYTLWLGDMQADCYYNTYNEDGSQVDNEVYFYYGKNATTLTTELPFKLVGINLYFNSGISYDGKIITPMFVSGTYNNNTIPTFEQYGAMPSPEFPSEIKSVRGKNEFDISKIENTDKITNNGDGTLTLANTSSANGYINTGKKLSELCPDLKVGETYALTLKTTSTAEYIHIGEVWGNTYTKTITQTMLDSNVIIYGGYNTTDTISNIQIEKGTVATDYVPYNHIEFKTTGKNSLNIPNVYELYQYITNTSLSLPAGEYVLSAENIVTDTTNEVKDVLFVFKFIDGTEKYVYLSPTKTSTAVTFDKVVVSYNIYANYNYVTSIGVTATFTNLMLRRSTDDDTYESYKESVTTIPLLHDMRSLPNGTRDRIYYSNGKWYDEQRVNERVIKTNEGIWEGVAVRENTTRFYIRQLLMDMPQTTSNDNVICSHFPTNLGIYNNDEIGIYLNYANASYRSIYISVPKSIGATIEEIKAWFDENEVKIQYELAEPIVTEITDETTIAALESIKTFKGITNIIADAPSILTYYRDVPIVDEYETKQNANKTYKAIKSQFADFTIEQDNIKSTVSETITKVDEQGNKIGEVETSLNQVTQTAEETKSEVSKKVGNDEIISKINQSAEEVQIDANKISLKRKNVRFNI